MLRSFPLPDIESQIVPCFTPQHVRMAYMSDLTDVIDAVNAGDTEEAIRLAQVNSESDADGLIQTLRMNLQTQLDQHQAKKDRYETQAQACETNIQEMQGQLAEFGPTETLTDPNDLHMVSELTNTIRLMIRNRRMYQSKLEQTESTIASLHRRISSMEEKIEESL